MLTPCSSILRNSVQFPYGRNPTACTSISQNAYFFSLSRYKLANCTGFNQSLYYLISIKNLTKEVCIYCGLAPLPRSAPVHSRNKQISMCSSVNFPEINTFPAVTLRGLNFDVTEKVKHVRTTRKKRLLSDYHFMLYTLNSFGATA